MKRSDTMTVTLTSCAIELGEIMVFADGTQWDVVRVNGGTVQVRRRRWWRSILRRLWPFQFRSFWRRVWTR